MKYKQFKLCILFLLALGGLTEVQAQSLYVLERSGTKTDFALTNIKTLTFSGENLNVNKKDGSISSTALLSIRYLSFSPITGVLSPETESTSALVLYPNPVQDALTVLCQANNIKSAVTIEVLTIDGRIIYAEQYDLQDNTRHTINVSGWQRGLYLVRMNNGAEMITKKLIKK